MPSELMFESATRLAERVRGGELSAEELVEASLAAIETLQPAVNAFTFVDAKGGREAAARIGRGDPRPFAGVPIAVKDNRAVTGMPMALGSELFGDFTPRHDAFLVRRLREAGFVIIGKTALPEMGILPTTEPRRGGPARNPWALERTPGGSSGGSAAAVAAGMVPIAHGNDGGGSIRIPAACCGLVGLKPVRGRVSPGPEAGDSLLTVDGVLTRTVADTAALLDVLAGPEAGDATWAPPPVEPFADAGARPPEALRIAMTLVPPLVSAALDPECERATRAAAALLESLGHAVSEIASPWPEQELLADFTRVFGPQVATGVATGGRIARRDPVPDDVEPLTWALYEHAQETSALEHLIALERMKAVGRQVVTTLAPWDVLLMPSLAARPLAIGEVHGLGPDPMGHFRRSGQFTPYTAIVNVSGLPAISLPLFHGSDGLPTGIQLVGRAVGEGPLLALADQLEAALPWAGRRPTLATIG
ncbi:MAG TPA: amidase [Solirubrobacteraceae bacterium]|nr:amidase [Solirubrobacteraceae bacterium]